MSYDQDLKPTLVSSSGQRWRWSEGKRPRWKPVDGARGTPRSDVDAIAEVWELEAREFDWEWRERFGTEPPEGGHDVLSDSRPDRGRPEGGTERRAELVGRAQELYVAAKTRYPGGERRDAPYGGFETARIDLVASELGVPWATAWDYVHRPRRDGEQPRS